MTAPRKRVVVLISGGGSNMLALARAAAAKEFPAEIVGVLSDQPTAGGLAKAEALSIPTRAIARKDFDSKEAHESAIFAALDAFAPDILCLAGYMRILSPRFIQRYEGRMINIHPSLLPLFPGLHTHRRAIEAGMRISGCTVHFVTEGMDEGPIIGQAAVPVLDGDTPESLAARVLEMEHRLYPLALERFAAGKLRMEDGRTAGTLGELPAEAGRALSVIGQGLG